MKKNCKEILTIRHIINSLNNIMTRSSNITLDSEVIITDVNLQEFEAIGVHTIKDIFYGEDKIGIYVKPKETSKKQEITKQEQEIIKQEVLGIKPVREAEKQEPVSGSNWWEKYK